MQLQLCNYFDHVLSLAHKSQNLIPDTPQQVIIATVQACLEQASIFPALIDDIVSVNVCYCVCTSQSILQTIVFVNSGTFSLI